MTRIAVTGHASLDHVALLDGVPVPGRTTTILDRPQGGWPRLGGSPAFVAAALVQGGFKETFPICWIGGDADGQEYRSQLSRKHIPCDGVAIIQGARTPIAVLAYEPGGGALCLYHPGMRQELSLSPGQEKLIREADWVCVTIGPPSITDQVLDRLQPATKLAWVVKNDPRSITDRQAARLAARADLICFSEAEANFVRHASAVGAGGQARDGQIRIKTRGRSEATLTRNGKEVSIAATPVEVDDPTGAGDTFAGGVLTVLASGESDPASIIEAGHRAAGQLLEARQSGNPKDANKK